MTRTICQKCKKIFPLTSMTDIHLAPRKDFALCPICMAIWTNIYNRWQKTTYQDFWNRGWKQFINGKPKRKVFNPSRRGSK